uniref:Kinesinlike protein putative n=1 Tax=Albugo laibachii Nc14 TaxID=890382 RepID=F0WDX5_9STRA|nr:kinesinlike protein putative [Albugo laibachii Nc14]|eukprot:CCA19403.1 kinesinlike protein putative [Albugo laibachii Nc14]
MSEDNENVKVFCRVRPPNEREKRLSTTSISSLIRVNKCISVPTSDSNKKTVVLHLKSTQNQNQNQYSNKPFTYDRVFDENSTQEDVFQVVGIPITKACLQGYNGTIVAYGQTGSGKTFTMQGPDDAILSNVKTEDDMRGLVPRVFDYLYNTEAAGRNEDNQETHDVKDGDVDVTKHRFTCSFLEIYNERVYDLLDSKGNSNMSTTASNGLSVREDSKKGVFVEGLTLSEVDSARKAAELMRLGAQNRRVGQTAMNRESSRSHSVFILNIESTENVSGGLTRTRSSRFSLVDLAGSERQKSTESSGDRLKEAGSINKSLSALGNVIMGLVNKSAGKACHVHFRDSKLTFLLKDSLGGNSKTFMIATISPAEDSANETLSTLKFAQRAKMIRNQAFINENTSGDLINLQQEVQRLRLQLSIQGQFSATQLPAQIDKFLHLDDKPFDEDDDTDTSISTDRLDICSKDIRLKELEWTLAITAGEVVKLNSDVQRSLEKEQRLGILCEESKKKLQHSKLLLRFANEKLPQQQREDFKLIQELIDREMAYEPSIDAIEWRLKFEKMEEAYAKLDASFERKDEALNDGLASTELLQLHDRYRALSKQFAYVLYDKHCLERQLRGYRENGPESIHSDSEDEMQHSLKIQAQEYEAKLSAAIQVQISLEQKAASVANDLLRSRQREAAWTVRHQDAERQYSEALFMYEKECTTSNDLRNQLLAEKERNWDLLLEKERDQLIHEQKIEALKEVYDSHDKLSIRNQWLSTQLQLLTNHRQSLENVIDHLYEEKEEIQSSYDSTLKLVRDSRSKGDDLHAKLTETSNMNRVPENQLISRQESLIDHKRECKETQGRLGQAKVSQLKGQLYGTTQELSEQCKGVKHDSNPQTSTTHRNNPNQIISEPNEQFQTQARAGGSISLNSRRLAATTLAISDEGIPRNVHQSSTAADTSTEGASSNSGKGERTRYIVQRNGDAVVTQDKKLFPRDQFTLLRKVATSETEKLILQRDFIKQDEKLEKVEATLRVTKQDLMLEKRLRSEDVMQLAAFKNKLEILIAQFKRENDDLQYRFSQLEFEFVKNKRMLEESRYQLSLRDHEHIAAKQVYERLLMESVEAKQRLYCQLETEGYIPLACEKKKSAFWSTSDTANTPTDNVEAAFMKMQADLQAARNQLDATHTANDAAVELWRSQLNHTKQRLDQVVSVAAAKDRKLQELEKRCVMLTRLAENRSMLLTTYEEEVAAVKATKLETERDLLRIRKNLGDLGHLLDRRGESSFRD